MVIGTLFDQHMVANLLRPHVSDMVYVLLIAFLYACWWFGLLDLDWRWLIRFSALSAAVACAPPFATLLYIL
jgi:hypothetical protein